MMKRIFLAWLSIVTLVASNPVPQVFPAQQYASYNNPYTQHATVQNQAPTQNRIDGTVMNELLMNKILKNPCLQKILDPNTKLFSQNGREVQRQSNPGASPSVVNNYFIVPPEFFSLNSNKTEENLPSANKKKRIDDKKANLAKNKTQTDTTKEKERGDNITNGIENNNIEKVNKKKKKQKSISAKMIQADAKTDEDIKKSKSEVASSRKKIKQGTKKKRKPITETSSVNGDSDIEVRGQVNTLMVPKDVKTGKKPKKSKTTLGKDSNIITNKTRDNDSALEKSESNRNITSKNKKVKSKSESYLKNIESPIDNNETKKHQEIDNSPKKVKEIRETKNRNADKAQKEPLKTNKQVQSTSPVSDDMLKNFYPFMNSDFYSNGNNPFNFEQFYKPFININNNNNRTNKNRNDQSKQQKKDSEPKVVEVKLKQKKHENTVVKPVNENHEKVDKKEEKNDSKNMPKSTEPDKFDTNMDTDSVQIIADNKEFGDKVETEVLTQESIETKLNLEKKTDIIKDPETLKKENVASKSNLEMPPTMIEDLHQYITPELGSEDIVPTIHTNGIIDDYYPIFYDNPHYENDESYHLKDFEDDRHFYTTDRGFDEPLSRGRRKYERYEDFPISNLDIKDRINYRRTYKFREKDKGKLDTTDKGYLRRLYPERNSEVENVRDSFDINKETPNNNIDEENLKQDISIEDQFQTPPLLENPDFKTTKIEKIQKKSDLDTNEVHKPIYMPIEKTDRKHDPKPSQYSRITNYESDDTNSDNFSSNSKPQSDTIETVFAKTRVVKYGVTKEEEQHSSSPLFDKDGEEFYSDGHTTYVLAKSLGHSDDYLW